MLYTLTQDATLQSWLLKSHGTPELVYVGSITTSALACRLCNQDFSCVSHAGQQA